MKKYSLFFILFLFFINKAKSQGGGGVGSIIVLLSQRSTVLYTDTVFELEQLQFKVYETYAFKSNVKTTMLITNLSNIEKTIYSEDITITDSENKAIVVRQKKPMVIAPNTAKKFGILAESKNSFKLYNIKMAIKKVYCAGKVISILDPPYLFTLNEEVPATAKIGDLKITRTKCSKSPRGITKVHFTLNYKGNNFLAIKAINAKLLTADKRTYTNLAGKSQTTYYPKYKEEFDLLLEFDNLQPNITGVDCDKVSFENVFRDYELNSNEKPFEFSVHKKSISKGESPKEEKED